MNLMFKSKHHVYMVFFLLTMVALSLLGIDTVDALGPTMGARRELRHGRAELDFSWHSLSMSVWDALKNIGIGPPPPPPPPTPLPTHRPTFYPTSMPSGQPSTVPSGAPTAQPTGSPTGAPSSVPTCVPTAVPTIVPSNSPTVVPTSVPSSAPTLVPTSTPTIVPTNVPSNVPSSVPSTVPTAIPSGRPTAGPTFRGETSYPSAIPTAEPTLTVQTEWKINMLNTVDSLLGRTIGLSSSAVDAVVPDEPVEYQGLARRVVSSHAFTRVDVPDEGTTKGGCDSWRDFWGVNGPLDLDMQARVPVAVGVASQKSLTSRARSPEEVLETIDNVLDSVKCTDITLVKLLMDNMRNGVVDTLVHDCNGTYWRSTACAGADDDASKGPVEVAICGSKDSLHCEQDICSPQTDVSVFGNRWVASCSHDNILVPPDTGDAVSDLLRGSSVVFVAAFIEKIPSPNVTSITQVVSSGRYVDVHVTLRDNSNAPSMASAAQRTKGSHAYCAAFPAPLDDDQTLDQLMNRIRFKDYFAPVEVHLLSDGSDYNATALVRIGGLDPRTNYTVYCGAMSVNGVLLDDEALRDAHETVSTSGMKEIRIRVSNFETVKGEVSRAFLVDCSAPPLAGPISLKLSASPPVVARLDEDFFVPSLVTFVPGNINLSTSVFFSSDQTGSHGVKATLTGPGAHEYDVLLLDNGQLFNFSTHNPSLLNRENEDGTPPRVTNAVFNYDLRSVEVTLNKASDRAGLPSTFNCLSLFMGFTCEGTSKTQWLDDSTLLVHNTKLVPDVDSIAIQPGKLGAKCYSLPNGVHSKGCGYPRASSDLSSIVTIGGTMAKPTVKVTNDEIISWCEDVVIDTFSSTGSGGRAWKSISISFYLGTKHLVAGKDLAQSYFDAFSTHEEVTLLADDMPSGRYMVIVELCNFAGECSEGTSLFWKLEPAEGLRPRVKIAGSKAIDVYSHLPLTLNGEAFLPHCTTGTSTTGDGLKFAWEIFSNKIKVLSPVSLSHNPRVFHVPGNAFEFDKEYTVRFSAWSDKYISSSFAEVRVNVLQGPIKAIITGGSEQIVSSVGGLKLDATKSLDLSKPQLSRAPEHFTYQWACEQVKPFVSVSTCGVSVKNSELTRGLLTVRYRIDDDLAVDSLGSVSKLSVVVTDPRSLRTATTSVLVRAVAVGTPEVTFSTTFRGKVNTDRALHLAADIGIIADTTDFVLMTANSVASLSSEPAIDASLSVTSFDKDVALIEKKKHEVSFLLPAHSLEVGTKYSFTLSCRTDHGLSVAKLEVETNRPPTPGMFTVNPTVGTELSTVFHLRARNWEDDVDDFPLSYLFFHISEDINERGRDAFVVLRVRKERPDSRNVLPVGPLDKASGKNILALYVSVFDVLNANTTITRGVEVASDVAFDRISTMEEYMTSTENAIVAQQSGVIKARATDLYKESPVDLDVEQNLITRVTSVLNTASWATSVDCTRATPAFCANLNRTECHHVPNTCGRCLSNAFVGEAGASNTACLPRMKDISLETGRSMFLKQVKTCPGDGTCGGIQRGACFHYEIDRPHVAVDSHECTLGNAMCEASCVCEPGFLGEECEMTLAQLESKMYSREKISSHLVDMETIEDTNSLVDVQTRMGNLAAAVAAPHELTSAARDNIAKVVAVTVAGVRNGFDDVGTLGPEITESLVDTVNELLNSAKMDKRSDFSTKVRRYRRRLASVVDDDEVKTVDNPRASPISKAVQVSTLKRTLDEVAALQLKGIVSGQDRPTEIARRDVRMSSMRLIPTVDDRSSSSSSELSLPKTDDEDLTGIERRPGLKFISPVDTFNHLDLTFTEKSALFYESADALEFSSSPLTLHLDQDQKNEFCKEDTMRVWGTNATFFEFKLWHRAPVEFVHTAPNATAGYVYCNYGDEGVEKRVYCGGSGYFNITCDGNQVAHEVVCPEKDVKPSCRLPSAASWQESRQLEACHVVDYSANYTVCRCSLCEMEGSIPGFRRLRSVEGVIGDIEITSMTSYVYTDFKTSVASLSNGDFPDDFADIKVVASFFVIAVGIFLMGVILAHYFYHFREEALVKKSKRRSRVRRSVYKKTAPEKGKKELIKLDDERVSKVTSFIESFFPWASDSTFILDMAVEQTKLDRSLKELRFFSLIFDEHCSGLERSVFALELFTALSVSAFLVSLLLDLQYPTDDGSCGTHTTQAACEHELSIFNSDEAKCSWNFGVDVSHGYDPHGFKECIWKKPDFRVFSLVSVIFVVVLLTAPMYALFDQFFKAVLNAPDRSRRENDIDASLSLTRFLKSMNDISEDVGKSISRSISRGVSRRMSAFRGTSLSSSSDFTKPRISPTHSNICIIPGKANVAIRKILDDNISSALATPKEFSMQQRVAIEMMIDNGALNSTLSVKLEQVEAYKTRLVDTRSRRVGEDEQTRMLKTAKRIYDGEISLGGRFNLSEVSLLLNEDTKGMVDVGLFNYLRLISSFSELDVDLTPIRDYVDLKDTKGCKELADLLRQLESELLIYRTHIISHGGSLPDAAGISELDHFDLHWGIGDTRRTEFTLGAASPPGKRPSYIAHKVGGAYRVYRKEVDIITVMQDYEKGIYLMKNFAMDMLSRGSNEEGIFSNKFNDEFSTLRLITDEVKVFVFVCVLVLDLFLVSICMAQSSRKNLSWQQTWMVVTLIKFIFDIIVKQSLRTFVIGYGIPNLLADDIKHIVGALRNGGRKLLAVNPSFHLNRFSASDYCFASSMLARRFPEVMESKFILMYTDTLPERLSWHRKEYRTSMFDIERKSGVRSRLMSFSQVFFMGLITFGLQFGSWRLEVQKVLLDLVPAFLLAAASWFLFLLGHTMSVIVLVTLIMVVLASPQVLQRYLERKENDRRTRDRIEGIVDKRTCRSLSLIEAGGESSGMDKGKHQMKCGVSHKTKSSTAFPPLRHCLQVARVGEYEDLSDDSLYSDEDIPDLVYDDLFDVDTDKLGFADNGDGAASIQDVNNDFDNICHGIGDDGDGIMGRTSVHDNEDFHSDSDESDPFGLNAINPHSASTNTPDTSKPASQHTLDHNIVESHNHLVSRLSIIKPHERSGDSEKKFGGTGISCASDNEKLSGGKSKSISSTKSKSKINHKSKSKSVIRGASTVIKSNGVKKKKKSKK